MPPAKLSCAFLILTMGALPTVRVPAQSTPTQSTPAPIAYDTQPLPKDPAAALLLAGQANGLGAESLKPWYLKAHYQTYDAQGKPASKGIFELYWFSEDHYKVSYADDAFQQTTYRTPDADYVVGSPANLPYPNSFIWSQIMHPVELRKGSPAPSAHEKKIGNIVLNCLESTTSGGSPADAYCLDSGKATLRIAEDAGYTTVYNHIELFQHRFSAASVSIREDREQVLTLERDTLKGLSPADEQTLPPPADARKIERFKSAPPGATSLGGTAELLITPMVMAGHSTYKAQPTYPAEAKQRGAQGSVRIAATIGKDGSVHNLIVVHDPDAALSKSALEAVSKWRYTPYVLDGAPVEVRTIIRVTFRLGR